jgi:hypothetical protein
MIFLVSLFLGVQQTSFKTVNEYCIRDQNNEPVCYEIDMTDNGIASLFMALACFWTLVTIVITRLVYYFVNVVVNKVTEFTHSRIVLV